METDWIEQAPVESNGVAVVADLEQRMMTKRPLLLHQHMPTLLRKKVRVAIIGVGNCASSLIQGIEYYKDAKEGDSIPGIMHPVLGQYSIADIEVVAAFDVVKGKVGVDLADAIFAHPNNTVKFCEVPSTGVLVSRGMTHDGIAPLVAKVVEKDTSLTVDVAQVLHDTQTDVVVNFLPVGSEFATKFYAEHAITAGCAFVNAIPVFLSSTPHWRNRFEQAGLPILGDDIKSQVGATIVHRVLTTLFQDRGVKLERTYQLNTGGNMDFLTMKSPERLESKKISKTQAVTSMLDTVIDPENVHIGPSDYVPWQKDNKIAFIRMEGTTFGDVPLELELRLSVIDSPNSAGIIIDAVRCAKIALDRGLKGAIEGPSSYFFKSPPVQYRDSVARQLTENFIADI